MAGGIRIKPGELGSTLQKIYQEYSDEIVQAMPDAVNDAVKVAKKTLKGGAPAKSGTYKASFASKKTGSSSSATTVEIYSKKPGLPHLLEFGHVIRNQYGVYGVSPAHPHWAPAEEAAIEELEKQITKKVEEAG